MNRNNVLKSAFIGMLIVLFSQGFAQLGVPPDTQQENPKFINLFTSAGIGLGFGKLKYPLDGVLKTEIKQKYITGSIFLYSTFLLKKSILFGFEGSYDRSPGYSREEDDLFFVQQQARCNIYIAFGKLKYTDHVNLFSGYHGVYHAVRGPTIGLGLLYILTDYKLDMIDHFWEGEPHFSPLINIYIEKLIKYRFLGPYIEFSYLTSSVEKEVKLYKKYYLKVFDRDINLLEPKYRSICYDFGVQLGMRIPNIFGSFDYWGGVDAGCSTYKVSWYPGSEKQWVYNYFIRFSVTFKV